MKSFPLLQSYLKYHTETSFIDGDNHTRDFRYLRRYRDNSQNEQGAHESKSSEEHCWLIITST